MEKYKYNKNRVRCDVTKVMWHPSCIMKCYEPRVVEKFSQNGVYANVCIYVCKKCENVELAENYGGVGCKYGK